MISDNKRMLLNQFMIRIIRLFLVKGFTISHYY